MQSSLGYEANFHEFMRTEYNETQASPPWELRNEIQLVIITIPNISSVT